MKTLAERSRVDFRVTGTGWAEVAFCFGDKTYVMRASYLSDPLGDLVRLALLAVAGAREGMIEMDGEGEEWRIAFYAIATPAHDNAGLIQLSVYDVKRDDRPDDVLLFRADYPTMDFGRDVRRVAGAARDAYLASWGRDWERVACPVACLNALDAGLKAYS